MTRTITYSEVGPVLTYEGCDWRIVDRSTAADGAIHGTGVLLDPDTGEQAFDETGFPITHSFFLGMA